VVEERADLRIETVDAPSVTFWGVRGSLPVPGAGTTIYGGNTACLEISMPGAAPDSILIVDAGSGLAALGQQRDWRAIRRVDLLLTHLHHDHVMGLPFFKAMHAPSVKIEIWCGNLGGETAESALECMFAPPLFPIPLRRFPAQVGFRGFRAGETVTIGGAAIRTAPLQHPSGCTAYRFDAPGGSLAVITDIEHGAQAPDPGVVSLCQGVDTLIYDAMIEEADYARCQGWGHSTIQAGVALAAAAGARRLVGTHHAPEHDDAAMAEREARLKALWPQGVMAREGMRLACAPSR